MYKSLYNNLWFYILYNKLYFNRGFLYHKRIEDFYIIKIYNIADRIKYNVPVIRIFFVSLYNRINEVDFTFNFFYKIKICKIIKFLIS